MLVIVAKVIFYVCLILITLMVGAFFLWGFIEAIREGDWLDIVLGLTVIWLLALFVIGAANG